MHPVNSAGSSVEHVEANPCSALHSLLDKELQVRPTASNPGRIIQLCDAAPARYQRLPPISGERRLQLKLRLIPAYIRKAIDQQIEMAPD
jgi:hypothetical protein